MSGHARPLALIEDAPGSDERLITLRGEIDVGSTTALREWLVRASESSRRSVAGDFTGVEVIAVRGLFGPSGEAGRHGRPSARAAGGRLCPGGPPLFAG